MYLPMERSKHSIIVSEPTLLGTKNRKQTKVVFFFMYKLVVLYSVPSCTVKTTLRWMRLYFMFFLFRSGLFVIHLFIIYVFCQWVKRAVLAALSIGWEHLQL